MKDGNMWLAKYDRSTISWSMPTSTDRYRVIVRTSGTPVAKLLFSALRRIRGRTWTSSLSEARDLSARSDLDLIMLVLTGTVVGVWGSSSCKLIPLTSEKVGICIEDCLGELMSMRNDVVVGLTNKLVSRSSGRGSGDLSPSIQGFEARSSSDGFDEVVEEGVTTGVGTVLLRRRSRALSCCVGQRH